MDNKITPALTETKFKISNMVCEGCAERITSVLKSLPGVKDVKSKVFQKQILVNYYADQIKPEELRTTLAKDGFTAIEI